MRTIAALVVLAASAMASCPNLCSGNGRCGADDKCTCYRGYTGTDCSGRKCPYGKAWVEGSAEDPHSFAECSNKGVCERASGMCSCYEGYEGTACHRSTCPGACSGHGVCRYIEELSTNYAEFNWDTTKIQGCDCDAGFTGLDCASRLCPIGDDPMTVAPSLNGQRWTVSVDFHGGFPTTAEIHLDIGNLEDGSTVSTRPINILANSTAPFAAPPPRMKPLPFFEADARGGHATGSPGGGASSRGDDGGGWWEAGSAAGLSGRGSVASGWSIASSRAAVAEAGSEAGAAGHRGRGPEADEVDARSVGRVARDADRAARLLLPQDEGPAGAYSRGTSARGTAGTHRG